MWAEHSVRTARTGYLLIAAAFCMMGISLIVFPEISLKILCCILGVVLMAYGVIKIIGYLSEDLYQLAFQFDLALGILSIFIGIMIMIRQSDLISFSQTVIGILIMTEGLFKIQAAVDARRFGMKTWLLLLLLAAAAGAAGMLVVIHPTDSARVMMILTGISLLAEGILSLFAALLEVKTVRRPKSDQSLS